MGKPTTINLMTDYEIHSALHTFRDMLQFRSKKIYNAIQVEKRFNDYLIDPSKAKNVQEDVIDRNLELMMIDSDLVEKVEVGVEKRKDFEKMK